MPVVKTYEWDIFSIHVYIFHVLTFIYPKDSKSWTQFWYKIISRTDSTYNREDSFLLANQALHFIWRNRGGVYQKPLFWRSRCALACIYHVLQRTLIHSPKYAAHTIIIPLLISIPSCPPPADVFSCFANRVYLVCYIVLNYILLLLYAWCQSRRAFY